ncbi:MAG TPA: lysozyme inhibitor LprI family protein [Bryobacteraceae bacterium]|nr:lysozyme inhibitor LprI family protein [Bryobacteraceae bacterium]
MRASVWAVAFVALVPCLVAAQDSAAYRACEAKAGAQPELNACAAEEAARVDAEMNRVYRELLAKNSDDAAAAEKIKKAQRAWVAFRDAYIEAMFPAEDKLAEYGSMYPMERDLILATLTRRQIDALKDVIQGR